MLLLGLLAAPLAGAAGLYKAGSDVVQLTDANFDVRACVLCVCGEGGVFWGGWEGGCLGVWVYWGDGILGLVDGGGWWVGVAVSSLSMHSFPFHQIHPHQPA